MSGSIKLGGQYPCGGHIGFASVSLSTAQLLTLHSNPITIVPAPGAGKAIIVLSSLYQEFAGTDPFASPDNGPGLYYGTNRDFANADLAQIPFLPEGCIYQAPPVTTNLNGSPGYFGVRSFMDNAAVVLANPSTNMTGGAGATGKITVLYYIVSTAP